MNGLLDDNSQAQLMLAAGLLSGGNFGQALQRGLLGYGQSMAASEARKTSAEDRLMRRQLQEAQMEETRAQAQQRMAQIEEIKRKQAQEVANRQLLQSGMTPQQMLASGVPAELVKNFAESQNWGRAKVGGTIETIDEQGRPVSRMRDEYGNIIGGDMRQWKAPQILNTGGAQTVFDPANRQIVGNIANTVSPDAALSAETARRGQNMVDARARMESEQRDKAPLGYRFKPDGSLEAIPGGPADIKAGELGEKRAKQQELTVAGASNVLQTIKEARNLVNSRTSGIVGGVTKNVYGTDARDLGGALETIKANIGFDRLQQMRDASPTGGALGQVAVQELASLQASIASLDQTQSPQKVRDSLNKIEKHYTNWLRTVQAAGQGRGGQSKPTAPPSDLGGFRILGVER